MTIIFILATLVFAIAGSMGLAIYLVGITRSDLDSIERVASVTKPDGGSRHVLQVYCYLWYMNQGHLDGKLDSMRYRRHLCRIAMDDLRQEMSELVRLSNRPSAVLYLGLFQVMRQLVLIKARWFAGAEDVRLAMGAELLFLRRAFR